MARRPRRQRGIRSGRHPGAPLSNRDAPDADIGAAIADLPGQAGDISFVIDELLRRADRHHCEPVRVGAPTTVRILRVTTTGDGSPNRPAQRRDDLSARSDRSRAQRLVTDYRHVHLGIGIVGNAMFFIGSVFFFERFADLYTAGVWLFVFGSLFMLLGAIGELVKEIYRSRVRRASGTRDG